MLAENLSFQIQILSLGFQLNSIADTDFGLRKTNQFCNHFGYNGISGDLRATFPAALARRSFSMPIIPFFRVLRFVGHRGFTIVPKHYHARRKSVSQVLFWRGMI